MSNPIIEGDPFGRIKTEKKDEAPPPRDVNQFHTKDDADTGPGAHHHTLGTNRNQASPGDHIHDGKSSKKLGTGLGLTIGGTKNTVGSEDSIVTMLKNLIDFTDNRT